MWGHVGGVESVSAGEGDGVGEDGARDGVPWAETGAVDEGFGFFALKTGCIRNIVGI